jgi:flagellar hook-basal body complex protein FliE
MIKAEEAGLATELLLEVRNRLVTAYEELMRMPV